MKGDIIVKGYHSFCHFAASLIIHWWFWLKHSGKCIFKTNSTLLIDIFIEIYLSINNVDGDIIMTSVCNFISKHVQTKSILKVITYKQVLVLAVHVLILFATRFPYLFYAICLI